jgi:hypothetical protein
MYLEACLIQEMFLEIITPCASRQFTCDKSAVKKDSYLFKLESSVFKVMR